MWTRNVSVVVGLMVFFFAVSVMGFVLLRGMWAGESEYCRAAKETIFLEQQLLDWTGEFPPEQVTDRWKKLLGGCND